VWGELTSGSVHRATVANNEYVLIDSFRETEEDALDLHHSPEKFLLELDGLLRTELRELDPAAAKRAEMI